ncbi:MAG: extracellular solute-binding protein [Chloroflexota bacterium]|nr:extracellular solute-binding protein [Chloroflexota bacterium]
MTYIAHDFGPREEWDAERIAEYEEQNPNVNIEQVVVPYPAFPDRVKASLAAGTVDIFAETTPLGPFFASGEVAPVDFEAMGFATEENFEALYIDGGLEPFSLDGVPYAVPNEATSYGFFINTAVLEDAGIDPETEAPETWEDVLALSQRIVERDDQGRFTRRGFDFAYPSTNNWISTNDEYFPMIAQLGGSIVSEDGTESTFDSPGTVEALEFIADWVHTHELGGPTADDVTDSFLRGEVAMIAIGPWFQPVLSDEAPEILENLMVVPFPVFEDAVEPFGPQLDGYGHMVNANSSPEEQREAWRFIAFLDSLEEDPIPYIERTGLLVPRSEVVGDADRLADTIVDHQVFLDALEAPQLGLFDQLKAPEISQAIGDAVDRIASGDQEASEAVAQADEEIQAALDDS